MSHLWQSAEWGPVDRVLRRAPRGLARAWWTLFLLRSLLLAAARAYADLCSNQARACQ